MTNEETTKLIHDVLMGIWPNWDINKMQFQVWVENLKPYTAGQVTRAAYDHYQTKTGQYKEPKLFDILEKIKADAPKPQPVHKQAHDFETDVFIKCVENDFRPARIGWVVPVIVERTRRDDRKYVRRVAEKMKQKFQFFYHGKWKIVTGKTYLQMQKSFARLRDKKTQTNKRKSKSSKGKQ